MNNQDIHHPLPIAPINPPAAAVSPVEQSDLPTVPALLPDPQWVRGECPQCGAPLVANMRLRFGVGYVVYWECWNSRDAPEIDLPSCDYKREL